MKYAPDDAEFWKKINLTKDTVDVSYICIGVKASNYFMPKETLSDKGPGGGGWIHMNKYMQVIEKYTPAEEAEFKNYTRGSSEHTQLVEEMQTKKKVWANGCIFAV